MFFGFQEKNLQFQQGSIDSFGNKRAFVNKACINLYKVGTGPEFFDGITGGKYSPDPNYRKGFSRFLGEVADYLRSSVAQGFSAQSAIPYFRHCCFGG